MRIMTTSPKKIHQLAGVITGLSTSVQRFSLQIVFLLRSFCCISYCWPSTIAVTILKLSQDRMWSHSHGCMDISAGGALGKFKEITAHSMCQSTVQRKANGLEGGTFDNRISVAILVQCTDRSHTPCSLCRPSQRPCMMALCCADIVCVTERKRSGSVTLKRACQKPWAR